MGGKSSKETITPSIRTYPDSGYPPSPVAVPDGYWPQPPQRTLDQKYSRILDDYQTLEQVTCVMKLFLFLLL